MHGFVPCGFDSKIDFSRSCSIQTLVGAEVSVIVEPLGNTSLELIFHQGFEGLELEDVLECSP